MSDLKNIKKLFNKILQFTDNDNYTIPNEIFTAAKWTLPLLQERKKKLNDVKSLLNNFPLEEWSRHTKSREPSSKIIWRIKQIHPFSLITIAWCKFYECLCSFELICKDAILNKKITTLHLCEAPGAFISALHCFIYSKGVEVDWNWYANTLNPDHEENLSSHMISDDRLLRHTYNNWLFGQDFTGDITKYCNHLDLIAKMKPKKNVWLITADGSIDCLSDPGNQENTIGFLLYCETITALALLEKGGTFVLKIFTFFEDFTISLLYLLNNVFQQVSIFKPVSSKSGNSEVYVICINYKGIELLENRWKFLIVPYKEGKFNPNTSFFDLNAINDNFLKQVISFSEFFVEKQIETIKGNIYNFRNMTQNEFKRVKKIQNSVTHHYIKKIDIQAIPYNLQLVPGINMSSYMTLSVAHCHFIFGVAMFETKQLVLNLIHDNIIKCKYGKRIDRVNNSRLCKLSYLSKTFSKDNFKQVSGLLYKQILKKLKNTSTIIDEISYNFQYYHEYQRYIFYTIYNSNKNSLIFLKTPFITNFLAGLLLLVISCFEKVYFHRGGCLILCDPTGNSMSKVKQILRQVHEKYRQIPSCKYFSYDLLHIVSPNLFYNNEYFRFLWNWNNVVLSKF